MLIRITATHNLLQADVHIYIYIVYIYIYIHTICIYIYIYIERETNIYCEGRITLCINDGVADSLQRSCYAS